MLEGNEDLLADYLDESRSLIDVLNEKFLLMESNPLTLAADPEMINETFRAAHSLKGLSASMGFDGTNKVTHRMEHILDDVRHGEIDLSTDLVRVLYAGLDVISVLTDQIAEGMAERSGTDEVCASIEQALAAAKSGEAPTEEVPAASNLATSNESSGPSAPPPATGTGSGGNAVAETIRVSMDRLDRLMNLTGELVISKSRFDQGIRRLEGMIKQEVHSLRIGEFRTALADLRERATEFVANDPQAQDLLDGFDRASELMDSMYGAAMAFHDAQKLSTEMCEAITELEGVADAIQDTVMEVRMVSLDPILKRFQRVVRDCSTALGKKVQLIIEGGETELDKRVADELVNPLTHLVRNAVDHGIEMPSDRMQADKPETGTVRLFANQKGSHVVIEVHDDGGGLDPEKLKAKALSKGLITQEEATGMSDQEAFHLIFKPGFSTAAAVTDISGRGMGMDIVIDTIQELRGTVEVESVKGEGSVFRVKLPLTLSILTCLLVRISGSIYAIPLSGIQEIISCPPEEAESIMGQRLIQLRDTVVPLVQLDQLFEFRAENAEDRPGDQPWQVVIVHSGNERLGVLVDELLRKEDLVVKPLAIGQQEIKGLSGTAILGDGAVTLILDPSTLPTLVTQESLSAEAGAL